MAEYLREDRPIGEWRLSCKAVVEHTAHAVDVGPNVDPLRPRLARRRRGNRMADQLRRHVIDLGAQGGLAVLSNLCLGVLNLRSEQRTPQPRIKNLHRGLQRGVWLPR